MELGAHVWLRKEDSHWGWVPAVITKKENVTHSGVDLINLTLNDDPQIEKTLPPPSTAKGRYQHQQPHNRAGGGSGGPRGGSTNYFADQKSFEVVVTVDPEQLKTADHDDIKLRNLPNSFHLQGEDPEARVVTSPSTHTQAGVVGGVNDLIDLTHLHEPAILHALRLRYDANIIYTATGPILIAVNPFRKMDIYGGNMMEKYCVQGEQTSSGTSMSFTTPFKSRRVNGKPTPQQSRLPPHVYQTADDAYRAMMRGMENRELMANPKEMRRGDSDGLAMQRENPTDQSILVSGESGAGKTVTTKFVLNYLAMLSRRRAQLGIATPHKGGNGHDRVSIEQQVLQSNPILESFGNARTIRNDNSSRFGKYIDIRFTRAGKLSGAQIETYLLEKVRLIHPGLGERNYHVFYQFLKSATHRERKEFFLGRMGMQDFRLLNITDTYDRRDGVSDESNHQEMLDAMVSGCGLHNLYKFCG
jgi:myosin-5